MTAADLIKARKQAEKAVADMPEGALKTKAFEVILSRLIAGQVDESGNRGEGAKGKERPRTRNTETGEGAPTSTQGRIVLLKGEGFFESQRSMSEVRGELKAHGWVYSLTSLSGKLQRLVQKRELRRILVTDGPKTIYKYVNP